MRNCFSLDWELKTRTTWQWRQSQDYTSKHIHNRGFKNTFSSADSSRNIISQHHHVGPCTGWTSIWPNLSCVAFIMLSVFKVSGIFYNRIHLDGKKRFCGEIWLWLSFKLVTCCTSKVLLKQNKKNTLRYVSHFVLFSDLVLAFWEQVMTLRLWL